MSAYYNEFDPGAAAWLRELIARGLIAPGDVDDRSILEVSPDDLRGYTQCHFFAGIGVWSYVLRDAGEPFLIGARGEPRIASRSVRSVIEAPRREHSRKPDEAYAAARALRPGVPALDLFSRESREGWTAFGDEASLFDEAAA